MTTLEKARVLERQRQQLLEQGTDEALKKAIEAFKEARNLIGEQLKTVGRAGARL
jgi:hypothetical protein